MIINNYRIEEVKKYILHTKEGWMDYMVVGDPYKFAICKKKKIECWSDDAYSNGILFFFIDGDMYPNELINETLKGEIHFLKEDLKNIGIDKEIYNMSKEEAFKTLYNKRYPED